ncbi:hypothetical protein RO3G_06067 [Rhizopus delemar RA 99-880]|uniref:Uncharacterized protein n=1 Tax=Rhizopus delemar (strain RA 99-880 / ATCC MYA-4621 / FGSC 9543 / NRRL 43880) TaxID=246409 RepID=I1BYT2_RHIO9|nr:hypothetical protein RO3G_06067 [Rhizopus delemar RA 99-880]|eukprot:EIE81362.1 hypothetical protein RO3G_06067 [Rhizopus delemar RA 99-880]
MTEYHIPYLSEDEKLFLNTTATYSQARRTSSIEQTRLLVFLLKTATLHATCGSDIAM